MQCLLGLIFASLAGSGMAARRTGPASGLPALDWSVLSWPESRIVLRAVVPITPAVEWQLPKGQVVLGRSVPLHWKLCGMVAGWTFPERAWTLASPVGALGDAFLGCRQVKVTVLDPRVRVADYPDGHFGEWVRDGWLVTRRVAIRDEARIRQIFDLLLEATIETSEPEELYFEEASSLGTFEEYRRRARHAPDLIVEFIGAVLFRAEICFERQTVVFISATEWEPGQLDVVAETALRKLVHEPEEPL